MTGVTPPWTEVFQSAGAEATRDLAARLGAVLRGGDLLILTGDLGAGKTTFTQGLATALNVRGQVSSPTFIIAREHPPLADGPALVHVDAYRLGGLAELDHLDLDSSLEDSVTVVEWGEGLAEALSADRLEISIARPRGLGGDESEEAADPESGVREITVSGIGPRWESNPLSR